ncbi:MAG TPA: two-component system response regulator [Deltaproteobacteria bacterium]|jgi:two-component system chemotaxis response regulator CheY|nr:two-component system response regulator [Deltaproteobacteria bacterium]
MRGRVLVADDAAFMRQMIREILEAEGLEVVGEAVDGVEAIDQFSKLHPDLVTMDIVMPRRSGIDAVKGILELDPQARVVMCSALGQETLVMEALQAGARDFIVKPFKPDNVIATLTKVLEKES